MSKLRFTKMHGTGNDYVYVDLFKEKLEDPAKASIIVSDRHFGVGSDGLICIAPSDVADCRMIMFNADGSEGAMCGNGVRCVAKYAYDHGIATKENIKVETLSGIKDIDVTVENGKVAYATVNMGKAILNGPDIPTTYKDEVVVDKKIEVLGKEYEVTCVSMGNPHCVIFTENIDDLDLEKIGPFFENYEAFPNRINTEFVEVIDENTLKMRVWERGSGETISCGTGTCATVVAAVLKGFCKRDSEVEVQIRGGSLFDTYLSSGEVIMRGPATEVFTGEIEID
ncbi:diaminopimelate epimerase [Eubacterium xylanophilum]|uniref:diaminopimelate epimerase n=1 Tax=Eubacterium xylanophilum TaxID=39497 RepID=UPI00047AB559|nr:diaminopimelate epimerase [Eubacterium xylanophilum]